MSAVVRNYPATCPVCGGCGTVPHDFYSRLGVATSTSREKCRSCAGTGIAWATETITAEDIGRAHRLPPAEDSAEDGA